MALRTGSSRVSIRRWRALTRRGAAGRLTASRYENSSCGRTPTITPSFMALISKSVNYHYWERRTITSEIRPIVGLHLHPVDIIFNPIVDTDYTGGFGNLEFGPATRIAYNVNDKWAVAAEEYSDFGPLRNFYPVHEQFQEVWAVVDHPTSS